MHMLQRQLMMASEYSQHRITEYEKLKADAEKKLAWYKELDALFKGLRTSWRDDDPGKYRPHTFFIVEIEMKPPVSGTTGLPTVHRCAKAWIPELLDDVMAAKKGIPHARYANRQETAPMRSVPLVNMSDLTLEHCETCRNFAPLVGTYRQTYDSPDGDEWRLDVMTLCIGCPSMTRVATRISEYRFM